MPAPTWLETLAKLDSGDGGDGGGAGGGGGGGGGEEEEAAPKHIARSAEKRAGEHLLASEPVAKRPTSFSQQLAAQETALSPTQLFDTLKHICQVLYASSETRAKLSEKEWSTLVERVLGDFDWRGLQLALGLARTHSQTWFPQVWLPLVYQTCSRLVRDPSSQGADAFRSGASFRGHPSAYFDIGPVGALRLSHSRWGKLRGYAFCAWVNLRKAVMPNASRQLFRFGNLHTGCSVECYLQENAKGAFQFFLRSRPSSNVSWSTCESPAMVALNRWHFIVVSHARPYLLGKAKLAIFVDGQQQCASSLPFPSNKDIDDCVLGQSLDGLLGAPSLYEGGDCTVADAVALCDRSKIQIETPHVVGEVEDDPDVDGEDDELTSGLGYGQADARDLHVDAREMIRELATRAGAQAEQKRMIFSFDPRAAANGHCPELVINGTSRGRLDALELSPLSGEDSTADSLMEDEWERDARLEGECSVCVESSTRRDCVELAGGCRALLMAIADAPRSAFGDALMFLGDALHADTHLRASFLANEGFELVGRAIRQRFYDKDSNEEDVVLVQVALHMMRAAPVKSSLEQRFLVAGLKELLLDSRVSEQRACQTLRLVSGLAADNALCIRQAVGVEGLLKFMSRLDPFPDSQAELVTEVLHHVWQTAVEPTLAAGPTTLELANVLGYIAEHPDSSGSLALLQELGELVRSGNAPTTRALSALGGVSLLIRLGSFVESNVKNSETGMIIKNPEPLPCILASDATPPETRSALIELVGALLRKRAAACVPLDPDGSGGPQADSDVVEGDVVTQLGHLLGTINSEQRVERDTRVISALLDSLPKPHGLFVWAVPCAASGNVAGMVKLAEGLEKNAALAKAMLAQKGWPSCFVPSVLEQGEMGAAASRCILAILTRAEDARHLDALVATTPALVWSTTVKSLIQVSFGEIPSAMLIRALAMARRSDMLLNNDQPFVLHALALCEQLRSLAGHWQSAWLWVTTVLPGTDELEVAQACVRLGLSIAGKELAKPASGENRRRVTQLLKSLGDKLDAGAGQLRAEMCLGLVQNFALADDQPAFQRYVQECLETSSTIPQAIRKVIDTLPNVVTTEGALEQQVKSNSVFHEPAVLSAAKQTAAFSLKIRQYLKKRAVEQVRDQLAFRVTERVRDRRFDARWAQLRCDDDVEHRAWLAESRAFKMDQLFGERGSRARRRLLHPSEEELAKIKAVVSRNPVPSQSLAQAPPSPPQQQQSEPTSADLIKIGEEVSRATQIKTHTDLDEVDDAAAPAAEEEDEGKKPVVAASTAPSLAPTPTAAAAAAAAAAAPADAKAKKMTMTEWVNRPPLSLRGELEGRWIDASAGERIVTAARAFIVRLDGECAGRLVISNYALYFDPDPPGSLGNYFEPSSEDSFASPHDKKKAGEDRFEPRQRWSLMGVQRVLLRRHRMMESGIELFMRGDANKSVFVRFEDVANRTRKTVRDRAAKLIISLLPRSARDRSQLPTRNAVRSLVDSATHLWKMGVMSNFDYLMELNLLAGRSVHDLCQYPVFPWILSDYTSDELDLNDPASYRDLSKPMGALLPERLEQYVERYETFDDPMIPKFHYGSHYSTAAGTALHFLVRVEPFRSLHVDMHDNRYDVPDRLFTSVGHSWESSYSSQDLGEVKELTSEFYYLPAMFENRGGVDLGTSQTGTKVDAVALPPWAKNSAHGFVRQMRQALESSITSANLHQWIDLVFGFKQRGEQAVLAHNVFFYLTYPGAVDLESMEDLGMRRAVEHQIAHFGQCPEQLESRTPWPARTFVPAKAERFVLRPRSQVQTSFSIDRHIPATQARVVLRKPISSLLADDAEQDDGGGGGILVLGQDGAVSQLIALGGSGGGSGAGELERGDSAKLRAEVRGIRQPSVWSADGTLLISASRAAQGTVELLQVGGAFGDPTAKATLFAHDEKITCLAYDDGLLLTGAGDGAIRLWRVGQNGALKRTTVWTRPRKFLCGHAIGESIVCAAVARSMGVAATASATSGILVHDVISGALLFRLPSYTQAKQLVWDSHSGALCVWFSDHSLAVVSIDGQVLRETSGSHDEISCMERIAPGVIALAKPSGVEVLELPTLLMVQSWPLPDVCAITPGADEHVVVNLVTASRTVFVLRRSLPLVQQQSAFKALREAPTAVVGAVSSAVSSRVNLVGALDKVRSGVEVGKGVSGEAWEAFSSATGGFFSSSKKEPPQQH